MIPELDVCIDTFFTDLPAHERIRRIADCGYAAIEFWFWDHEFDGRTLTDTPKDVDAVARVCRERSIAVNDIVVNSADGAIGGHLVRAEDRSRYLDRLSHTIEVARKLGCTKLITCAGNEQPGVSRARQSEALVATLVEAEKLARTAGMVLLLEPLNARVDHPGCFLTGTDDGFAAVRAVNSPHVRLLFDVYHMQIMQGNILDTVLPNLDLIGHFHSAGVPGRHELYTGELDYRNIVRAIGAAGYRGRFGLEYFPTVDHAQSLAAVREFLSRE
jgi:hydroxypyruvate isomerase